MIEDYECENCGCEHPDIHYCIECGEAMAYSKCIEGEGYCKYCNPNIEDD